MIKIALLPGDGIGTEVLGGPAEILDRLAASGVLSVSGPWPIGASAFAECGDGLPSETLDACEEADAILLGAVGDHPGVHTGEYRPELALIALRQHFDLRVSIRRIRRKGRPPLTFVRNLLGGAYGSGTRHESIGQSSASDLFELNPAQVRELAIIAIEDVRKLSTSLVSVDKANLLATSRLWRRVVSEVAAEEGVEVRHVYVDRMAFELGCSALPEAVVLTEGLFGDILSDLASARAGSIALCGSASVRPWGSGDLRRCVGLFEPLHGSAPLRAGQNVVNPCGGYFALAMLLEWFPETVMWAARVRGAVETALTSGPLTYDMVDSGMLPASTSELSRRINDAFAKDCE